MNHIDYAYIEYKKADKCWCFLKHTFLRFKEDPIFVEYVVIDGQVYKATRCYGSPPLVIQIEGEYEFKDLNVGFMMPSKKEQQERVDYILNEIKKVKKEYNIHWKTDKIEKRWFFMTEIELETYLGKKIRVTHICGKQVEGMCEIFTPALDNEPEVAEIA